MSAKTIRTAIYARYSSDIQNDRSIDDQIALCEQYARRERLDATMIRFSDRAKSGATLFDRDGLMDLMHAAKAKQFDMLIVESLDRLSRDQEDLAGLFKRLSFYGVELRTVNEGTTTPIHVGIRGLIGSMFLTDLAAKVRRGQAGRVREGKIPGAVTYGYRRIAGKPGERAIDPVEARIVRRIFREYAAGRSPRSIAADLTRAGITPPGGVGAWNHQTFIGGRLKRGMIGNPIYIGEVNWNVSRQAINPDNGRKIKRAAPAADHMIIAVPALRIVDQPLWDAANAMRRGRAVARFGPTGRVLRRSTVPHKDHLLAGLLRCGTCNGHMRIANNSRDGGSRIACAAAHQHGTCDHRKTYDLKRLETSVLTAMRSQLTAPELIAEAARSFHDEWSRLHRERRGERSKVNKRLANVQASILRYCNALERNTMPEETIFDRLQELERERVGLAERARLIEAETNVIDLHPGALDAYRANVEKLHAILIAGPETAEIRAAFRALVDNIVVHPTAKRAPYEFTIYGRLGAIIGVDLFPTVRDAKEILAEQGISCSDVGGPENPEGPTSPQIFSLGRWRERLAA